ncbi:hypothetical protein FOA52_001925 [Chlamydomonas sp. UWO 241]|nr:hypothetical protein FOA52_001925 [Chlamydomonas sp. UWO 241]
MHASHAFCWTGTPLRVDAVARKTFYAGFELQGVTYSVGDCCLLLPEREEDVPWLGRILAACHDAGQAGDLSHSIQLRWFDRLLSGNKVVERVAIDGAVPLGSIIRKCKVLRSAATEASNMADTTTDCFACIGEQAPGGELTLYEEGGFGLTLDSAMTQHAPGSKRGVGTLGSARAGIRAAKRVKAPHRAASPEDGAVDENEVPEVGSAKSAKGTHSKGGGKLCVECGATSTPQWREGPAGPKTLCNACGVRFNRMRSSSCKRNSTPALFGARAPPPRAPAVRAPLMKAAGSNGSTGRAQSPEATAATALMAAAPVLGPGGRRPLRAAAVAAATRTATFARTGSFDAAGRRAAPAVAQPHVVQSPLGSSATAASDDDGNSSADGSEESAVERYGPSDASGTAGSSFKLAPLASLVPAAGTTAAAPGGKQRIGRPSRASPNASGVAGGGGLVSPPGTARSDTATTAAAGRPQQQQQQRGGAGAGVEPSPTSTAEAAGLRGLALRALGFAPDGGCEFGGCEFASVYARFERARAAGALPSSALPQLLGGLGGALEAAATASAAADDAAAAASVAAAHAAAVAESAREAATGVVERLRCAMLELLDDAVGGSGGGAGHYAGGVMMMHGASAMHTCGGGGGAAMMMAHECDMGDGALLPPLALEGGAECGVAGSECDADADTAALFAGGACGAAGGIGGNDGVGCALLGCENDDDGDIAGGADCSPLWPPLPSCSGDDSHHGHHDHLADDDGLFEHCAGLLCSAGSLSSERLHSSAALLDIGCFDLVAVHQ